MSTAPDETQRTTAQWVQLGLRLLLGIMLLGTGNAHLTSARTEFQAQVPGWMPIDADVVVVVSGIVELCLGAALILLGRYRVLVGIAVAAFFVAVFPGNVSQYLDGDAAFGLDSDVARAVRLAGQPVLVAWALWSTGAWTAYRARSGASGAPHT